MGREREWPGSRGMHSARRFSGKRVTAVTTKSSRSIVLDQRAQRT
ncbi:hypothetical protein RBWH47_02833 [Rhodopirellula baltica WH47]|uniref:Uncharacterized protein n=1 Tax=Rhodopirellula baltica WH47 TaxID=991778 RepID=F2AZE0_RHOBT|nr:hypothetical protein RBWH47_02833 [Rhodopirellula baltica WH47]